MNEILAISLQAMQGDMARLDQTAANLTNVMTPGYKRGIALQGATGASFAARMELDDAKSTEAPAPAMTTAIDSRSGTLKFTGQSFDLAIAGKGFFEIATEHGPAFTRDGTFHLDARGRLVTAKGDAVMGTGGEITLPANGAVIDASGTIRQSSAEDAPAIARLKVVDFDGEANPTRLGDNLMAANTSMKPVADADVQVRQGYLENSNVNSAREMTSLVETMRHFETMQKLVQSYDDMLGTAIRKLGDN